MNNHKCTHPDHNDNETCEDRAVGCHKDCSCCMVIPNCVCGSPGESYHPCPGKVEMCEYDVSLCNCCEACQDFCQECT